MRGRPRFAFSAIDALAAYVAAAIRDWRFKTAAARRSVYSATRNAAFFGASAANAAAFLRGHDARRQFEQCQRDQCDFCE